MAIYLNFHANLCINKFAMRLVDKVYPILNMLRGLVG